MGGKRAHFCHCLEAPFLDLLPPLLYVAINPLSKLRVVATALIGLRGAHIGVFRKRNTHPLLAYYTNKNPQVEANSSGTLSCESLFTFAGKLQEGLHGLEEE